MNNKNNHTDTFSDFEKYFSKSQLQSIKNRGYDIIEQKRDGAYIIDNKGKKYIDCNSSNGIYNLGRLNREVAAELSKAIYQTDQGNFPMISIEKSNLAEKLAKFTPGNLECTVFSVIRGESIDFACKLARGATGRTEYVTVDGSYFGETGFALSLSEHRCKDHFGGLIPDIKTIEHGNMEAAKAAISKKTAAFIIEPIQAENNCRVASNEYLREIRKMCDKHNVPLIFDETQSGMGRSGKKFAFEHSGVIPNVLVIGESLGAGIFPIAATIFTQKLNKFLNAHPMIHLSTFGGSDLGCRTASKALEIYDDKSPWENAEIMGNKIISELKKIKTDSSKIKSISGRGLLISMKLENEEMALSFSRQLVKDGIIAGIGRVDRSTIIIRPALTINEEDGDNIISSITKSLKTL